MDYGADNHLRWWTQFGLRLPPYFTNIAKRVVKSPKVYFTDVGLVAYLLGIEDASQLRSHPLRGSLFENMVVADIRKGFTNSGRDPRMSFYRTEKGFEVDVIVSAGGEDHDWHEGGDLA